MARMHALFACIVCMQPVKREALTAAQQAVVQDIEAEHKVQDTLLDQMADAALTLTTRAHHINDELQKSDAVRAMLLLLLPLHCMCITLHVYGITAGPERGVAENKHGRRAVVSCK